MMRQVTSCNFFENQGISRGFLPQQNPLQEFKKPSALQLTLCKIAKSLPQLIRHKQLREAVDQLNLHDNLILHSEEEKKFALTVLLMMTQAYIFEEPSKPSTCIPVFLARHIIPLCKTRQRLPTLTYEDYILLNWKLSDPTQGFTIDNIEPLFSFTGSKDEAWFIKIHVAIEASCGKALEKIYQSCFMPSDDILLMSALKEISLGLAKAIQLLGQMKEGCRAGYYWSVIRPYLMGWESVKNLSFAQSHLGFETLEYKGPSGAQSSIIPALDAVLGIQHAIKDEKFLTIYLPYMPKKHQTLIYFFRENSVANKVTASSSMELKLAYSEAVRHLKLFRLAHFGLVSQYLVKPAATHGIFSDQIIGTGGSQVSDFLSQRIQNTVITAKL